MNSVVSFKPADRAFTPDPEQSYTVPARYSYAPDVFEREKDAIFYRTWQYVGHASQLAEPGCYLTASIHEQNVFVIRGDDGELRAFYNVCQHRGHELLQGTGVARSIVCP